MTLPRRNCFCVHKIRTFCVRACVFLLVFFCKKNIPHAMSVHSVTRRSTLPSWIGGVSDPPASLVDVYNFAFGDAPLINLVGTLRSVAELTSGGIQLAELRGPTVTADSTATSGTWSFEGGEYAGTSVSVTGSGVGNEASVAFTGDGSSEVSFNSNYSVSAILKVAFVGTADLPASLVVAVSRGRQTAYVIFDGTRWAYLVDDPPDVHLGPDHGSTAVGDTCSLTLLGGASGGELRINGALLDKAGGDGSPFPSYKDTTIPDDSKIRTSFLYYLTGIDGTLEVPIWLGQLELTTSAQNVQLTGLKEDVTQLNKEVGSATQATPDGFDPNNDSLYMQSKYLKGEVDRVEAKEDGTATDVEHLSTVVDQKSTQLNALTLLVGETDSAAAVIQGGTYAVDSSVIGNVKGSLVVGELNLRAVTLGAASIQPSAVTEFRTAYGTNDERFALKVKDSYDNWNFLSGMVLGSDATFHTDTDRLPDVKPANPLPIFTFLSKVFESNKGQSDSLDTTNTKLLMLQTEVAKIIGGHSDQQWLQFCGMQNYPFVITKPEFAQPVVSDGAVAPIDIAFGVEWSAGVGEPPTSRFSFTQPTLSPSVVCYMKLDVVEVGDGPIIVFDDTRTESDIDLPNTGSIEFVILTTSPAHFSVFLKSDAEADDDAFQILDRLGQIKSFDGRTYYTMKFLDLTQGTITLSQICYHAPATPHLLDDQSFFPLVTYPNLYDELFKADETPLSSLQVKPPPYLAVKEYRNLDVPPSSKFCTSAGVSLADATSVCASQKVPNPCSETGYRLLDSNLHQMRVTDFTVQAGIKAGATNATYTCPSNGIVDTFDQNVQVTSLTGGVLTDLMGDPPLESNLQVLRIAFLYDADFKLGLYGKLEMSFYNASDGRSNSDVYLSVSPNDAFPLADTFTVTNAKPLTRGSNYKSVSFSVKPGSNGELGSTCVLGDAGGKQVGVDTTFVTTPAEWANVYTNPRAFALYLRFSYGGGIESPKDLSFDVNIVSRIGQGFDSGLYEWPHLFPQPILDDQAGQGSYSTQKLLTNSYQPGQFPLFQNKMGPFVYYNFFNSWDGQHQYHVALGFRSVGAAEDDPLLGEIAARVRLRNYRGGTDNITASVRLQVEASGWFNTVQANHTTVVDETPGITKFAIVNGFTSTSHINVRISGLAETSSDDGAHLHYWDFGISGDQTGKIIVGGKISLAIKVMEFVDGKPPSPKNGVSQIRVNLGSPYVYKYIAAAGSQPQSFQVQDGTDTTSGYLESFWCVDWTQGGE